jgi:hypothetical protein
VRPSPCLAGASCDLPVRRRSSILAFVSPSRRGEHPTPIAAAANGKRFRLVAIVERGARDDGDWSKVGVVLEGDTQALYSRPRRTRQLLNLWRKEGTAVASRGWRTTKEPIWLISASPTHLPQRYARQRQARRICRHQCRSLQGFREERGNPEGPPPFRTLSW